MDARSVSNASSVEAVLADRELQDRVLVEESSDVLAIHEPNGVLRWISPAVERVFGWTPEQRIQHQLDLIHSDDKHLMVDARQQLAEGASSVVARMRLLRADGTFRWAESIARAVRDPDGAIVALVTVTRDVHDQVSTEQALAEAEGRYRLIAENAGDVVLDMSSDEVIDWISPSASQVLRYAPADVIGRQVTEFIHPDDVPGVYEGAQRLLEDARAEGRCRVRLGDGAYRWFSWTQRRVPGDAGRVNHITTLRDIDAAVQAEEALAASLEFYRLLAENTTDVVLRVSPDGMVQWASPAAERTLHWRPEELVGRYYTDFVPPEELDALLAVPAREEGDTSVLTVTLRMLCGDGSHLWVEAASQVAPDADGQPHLLVVRVRDVQDQHEAFQQLARSENRFRSAMRDAGIGMCLTSRTGAFLEVNDSLCAYLGRDENMLKQLTWQELTHPDDLEADLHLVAQVIDGTRSGYRLTKRFLRPDGSTVFGDMTVTGVRDADGELDYFIAQIVDITVQMNQRAALAASEEQFRMLAENASDVVLHARNRSIIWVSPSLTDALGWAPQDWIGHKLSDFVHPDDQDTHATNRERIMSGERRLYRMRVRTDAGDYHWVEVHARPYESEDGGSPGVTASLRVVDAEVSAREDLARSEETFRTAMESAPSGMAVVDLDRRFVEVNPALCDMVGRDEEWLLDHRVADILRIEDNDLDLRMRAELQSGHAPSTKREKRLVAADGSQIWVEHSIGLLRDDEGVPRGYVSQFVNITDARQAREELRFMATHDPLTRLVNRPALLTQMQRILTHPPRGGTNVAALFIDLDGLKGINDTFGHHVGDSVIIEVAQRIRAQVRAEDLVARLGGDEFVVFLPAVRSQADAERIAEKIQAAVGESMSVEHHTIRVTLSIGVSLAAPGDDADQVLEFADRALYRAKRGGRARTVVFDPDIDMGIPTQ